MKYESEYTVNKTAILLNNTKIGNNDLKVYVEPIDNVVDFSFTVNDTYITTIKNFSIYELYQIYSFVQESLIQYIEKTVLTSVEKGNIIHLLISACGLNLEEIESKSKIYDRQIKKLTDRYNCDVEKSTEGYVLTFKPI